MQLRISVLFFSAAVGLLLSAQVASAQSPVHSNWVFGGHCSLSWDGQGQRTAGTNPVINTVEGVATYRDPQSGQLILFTDGITAWNGNDAVVSTGPLGGHPSAAQSGIIVPVPGQTDEFYIFAQPRLRGAVQVSRFDMSGDGALIAGPTVIAGTSDSAETLGAAPHLNLRDFWIITSTGERNAILVIAVTPDGVSDAVVHVQEGGSVPGGLGQFAFTS